MSTGRKLSIMFVVMALVIATVLISHTFVISKLQNKIIEQETLNKQNSVEYAIDQSKSFLSKFAEDYTLWDEMIGYIDSPDTSWIKNNITPMFKTTPIKYAWIMKKTESGTECVYNSNENDSICIMNVIDWNDFENKFIDSEGNKISVFYFYTKVDSQLIEIAAAKVFGSEDYERSGKSNGYFLIGKPILPNDLDVLTKITDSEVRIAYDTITPKTESEYQNIIAVRLANCSNDHIANMIFTSEQVLHKETMKAARKIFNNLAVILGLGIIFVIWYISKTVSRPINKIKAGLDTHTLEPVVDMLERRDEFGEIANLIQRIIEQEKELKDLNATKDRFFSIIAHDLKNPFGVILSTTEFLSNPEFELSKEETGEFTRDLHASAKLVFNLLENLLTWARTQKGSIQYEPEEINLAELAEMPIYVLKNQAEEKNISLMNKIPKETFAYCDENMIRTVIRNLISNAIKFTRVGGKIEVSSQILTIAERKHVEVTVKDNGVGMPDRVKDKLFKIGENVTTVGTAEEQGTGLGLILVQEFLTRNGGTIRVESEEGVGSKFIFTLPG